MSSVRLTLPPWSVNHCVNFVARTGTPDVAGARPTPIALTCSSRTTRTAILAQTATCKFDLLTKPDLHLSIKEERQVKDVAKELLKTLKGHKLVLDWRKRQQTRAAVRLSIEQTLDELPDKYTRTIYAQKCDSVYQHFYEAYYGEDRSVYSAATA